MNHRIHTKESANSESFKIEKHGDNEIVITRLFNAPPEMIFDAYTKPELIKKWLLGPDGWTMPVCEVDLRVGGKYRYVWARGKDEMGMGGVYKEIQRPIRLSQTELFDVPWYDGACLATMFLTQQGSKTFKTSTVRFDSKKIRDEVFDGPMSSGMIISYDRLENLLTSR